MNDISRETPGAAAEAADAAQSLGQLLKQERLRQNKTLKEIAEATCIHINTIEALEEENRNRLPAEVFVRGFISIYAQHLGLDPQDALNRYGRKRAEEWVTPGTGYEERKILPPKSAPRPRAGGRGLVLLGLLAVLGLLGFWGYRQAGPPADRPAETAKELLLPDDSPAAEPEVAEAESWPDVVAETTAREEEAALLERSGQMASDPPAQAPERKEIASRSMAAPPAVRPAPEPAAPRPAAISTISAAAAAEPAVSPASDDAAYVLEATFSEATWLRVRLDGGEPEEYLFQPGERHIWKAAAIELFLGNAGGVDLVLNGQPQPQPGPSGKTARLRFADRNP